MQTHTHNNRRIIQHDDNHYDIEEERIVLDDKGNIGYVWAVIYCSEDEMNGYTKSTPIKTRVMNLVEQIPTEYRNRAVAECVAENPHDFERALTGYVMGRTWETYPHPVNEAEAVNFTDAFSDPRTDAEKAADAFQDEYSNDATLRDIRAGFQQW